MDRNPREHFETIIELAHAQLTDVRILQNDVTPSRAILQLRGKFGEYDVWLKQIVTASESMYSYYIVQAGTVIVGFDNYPDVEVLKAQFGRSYRHHLNELISHRHGRGKHTVALTDRLGAQEFLNTLEDFVSSE